MRKLSLTLAFLLLCTAQTIAQSLPWGDSTYLEGGFGIGTATQIKLAVNHIFRSHRILAVQGTMYIGKSGNVPPNYTGGGFGSWDPKPKEYHYLLSVLYGDMIDLGTHVRVSAKGGLSGGVRSYPDNFTSVSSGGMFFSSTDWFYDRKKVPVFGAVLNPSLEFLLGGSWGLSTGVYTNINNSGVIVGVEFNMLLGAISE